MPIVSGGGGGAAYTPPTARAQYATSPTPVTIANGATAPLTWALVSGTALLSLTAPAAPTIVTAGVYAIDVQVNTGASLTVGGYFTVTLDVDASGEDPQLGAFSNVESATLNGPRVLLGMTYYVPAGGAIVVAVTNKDGAASRDFLIALAAIQRLS